MKKSVERKRQVLESKINELSYDSAIEELYALDDEIRKFGHLEIKNYPILLDKIYKKDSFKDRLILEQIYVANEIIKEDFQIETKRVAKKLVLMLIEEKNECHDSQLLVQLTNRLAYAEEVEKDKEIAQMIDDMIAKISIYVTIYDRELIQTCNEEYNKQTDRVKGFVTKYCELVSANEKINAILVAKEIDDLIETLDVEKQDEVFAVYNRYLAMTELEVSYLTNSGMIEDLVKEINEINLRKSRLNEAAIVDKQILLTQEVLCDEATFNEKMKSVELLEYLYNKLDDEQIMMLNNGEVYDLILNDIKVLKYENEECEKALLIKDEINKIPANIEDVNPDEIICLINRYDQSKHQELITNYDILIKCQSVIEARRKAKEFDNKVNELNIDQTKEMQQLIKKYNKEDILVKSFITMFGDLKRMYIESVNYHKAVIKAKEIEKEILNLSINDSLENIMAIYLKCELLSKEEKELVSNYYLLENAVAREKGKAKALEIQEAIKKLDALSLDDLPVIEELYFEYECLDETGKSYVKSIDVLDKYLNQFNEEISVSEAIVHKIDCIKDVLIDEGNSIADIRSEYEMLSIEQKALITNIDVLINAEKEFIKISSKDLTCKVISYVDEQIINFIDLYNDELVCNDKKVKYAEFIMEMYNDLKEDAKLQVQKYNLLVGLYEKISQ